MICFHILAIALASGLSTDCPCDSTRGKHHIRSQPPTDYVGVLAAQTDRLDDRDRAARIDSLEKEVANLRGGSQERVNAESRENAARARQLNHRASEIRKGLEEEGAQIQAKGEEFRGAVEDSGAPLDTTESIPASLLAPPDANGFVTTEGGPEEDGDAGKGSSDEEVSTEVEEEEATTETETEGDALMPVSPLASDSAPLPPGAASENVFSPARATQPDSVACPA